MPHNIRPELARMAKDIDSVQLHPRNVRQGDVGAIALSLSTHGQYRPIVVQQSTGQILAGNHTYKAAVSLGWDKVAVNLVDCTDDEALRILLADNRANDLASYDDAGLLEVLKELAGTPLQLEQTLYELSDLDDLIALIETMPFQPTTTNNAINDLHEYLATVRIVLDLPSDVADKFNAIDAPNNVERLKLLLNVS